MPSVLNGDKHSEKETQSRRWRPDSGDGPAGGANRVVRRGNLQTLLDTQRRRLFAREILLRCLQQISFYVKILLQSFLPCNQKMISPLRPSFSPVTLELAGAPRERPRASGSTAGGRARERADADLETTSGRQF